VMCTMKIILYFWQWTKYCWQRLTGPLVREGTPQRQHSKFQTENNIWSQVPEWTWHQDWLTDWPSVVTWLWLWRGVS
jgi:hypothetical protein